MRFRKDFEPEVDWDFLPERVSLLVLTSSVELEALSFDL